MVRLFLAYRESNSTPWDLEIELLKKVETKCEIKESKGELSCKLNQSIHLERKRISNPSWRMKACQRSPNHLILLIAPSYSDCILWISSPTFGASSALPVTRSGHSFFDHIAHSSLSLASFRVGLRPPRLHLLFYLSLHPRWTPAYLYRCSAPTCSPLVVLYFLYFMSFFIVNFAYCESLYITTTMYKACMGAPSL